MRFYYGGALYDTEQAELLAKIDETAYYREATDRGYYYWKIWWDWEEADGCTMEEAYEKGIKRECLMVSDMDGDGVRDILRDHMWADQVDAIFPPKDY